MIGKIFITSSGYDPQLGKHVKDPYLGSNPSMGACRPDLRRIVKPGDHIFVISGKIKNVPQFLMGGFEVERKIPAIQAYDEYPHQRLQRRENGELSGNIIVNDSGLQHSLDNHTYFERRVENYIVGKSPLRLVSDQEIEKGREETMGALQEILKKKGETPFALIGRSAMTLTENQIEDFRSWLNKLKTQN